MNVVATTLLVGSLLLSQLQAAEPPRRELLRSKFLNHDANQDRKLSVEEYATLARSVLSDSDLTASRARRDARLFDGNRDGQLDLGEFLSIPALLPATQREPVADPFRQIANQYVTRLDEEFVIWKEDSRSKLELKVFEAGLAKAFGLPENHGMQSAMADADRDGFVTRSEARVFVEKLLGLRRSDGKTLRFDDGRVVKFSVWDHLNVDQNDLISRRRYELRGGSGSGLKFVELGDLNHDGSVSFDEFCRSEIGFIDVPARFCELDQEPDGLLTKAELVAGLSLNQQALVPSVFPAFDDDRDGKLSLDEFSVSMLSNELLLWSNFAVDINRDGRLSFDEFLFGKPSAVLTLLRWEMFRRLDSKNRGWLDKTQFDFRSVEPRSVFVVNADGTGLRHLLAPPGFLLASSISAGPGGESFSALARNNKGWRLLLNEKTGLREFDLKLHENTPLQSDWSFDGQRLAWGSQELREGRVRVALIDGSQAKDVAVGFSPRWSPSGERLAFVTSTSLCTVDWRTEHVVEIVGRTANDRWQFRGECSPDWSPDGSQLGCWIYSDTDSKSGLYLVSSAGAAFGFKCRFKGDRVVTSLSWHPDGKRLVFATHCPELRRRQLYELDPATDDPPLLVPGQDPHRHNEAACWTRDGSQLLMISGDQ